MIAAIRIAASGDDLAGDSVEPGRFPRDDGAEVVVTDDPSPLPQHNIEHVEVEHVGSRTSPLEDGGELEQAVGRFGAKVVHHAARAVTMPR